MLYLLISSLIVMTASLSGVVVLWKRAGNLIKRNLKYLVSLSAGVFLAIAVKIILETTEHSNGRYDNFIWILVGAVGIFLVFKFLPTFHHHHDESEEDHTHSKLDVRRIITADSIHNIADGVLLASSFAISPALGIIATASILFHEIIQETSEFFVMLQAGYSTRKALVVNFAASSTILIGSIGAFFLLNKFESFEIPLLGVSAGIFLLVVFLDLIPHSVRHSHKPVHYFVHLIWFILGFVIMSGLIFLSPHSHNENNKEIPYVALQ